MKEKEMREMEDNLIKFTSKRSIVKLFLKSHPIFYDRSKVWWVWDKDKFCWYRTDEVDLMRLLNIAAEVNTINSKERGELLEALKQESREYVPEPISPYWIQFKNRIFDIMENQIIIPSPKFFVTNPIPYDMGESEDTPIMDRIFKEWVGEDYVQTLYEIIAYCTLPSYPIHRIFCFIGAGMNGKSKFLELVRQFIGTDNCATTELDRLLESRFELTRLHKKLVCMMGETNFNEMKKTSILKSLSGGDLIGFEYKNKDPFQDVNYSKILISTNNLPTTTDKTIGFYRRWLIIDFPNVFNEKKNILSEIPDVEYQNLARKTIKILQNLLLNREFYNEGSVDERMHKFEEKSNPFGKFFELFCEEGFSEEDYIPKFEFKKRLDDWCRDNNYRKLSDSAIAAKMKEMNIETMKITMPWYNNENERPRYNCWANIKWRTVEKQVVVSTLSGCQ